MSDLKQKMFRAARKSALLRMLSLLGGLRGPFVERSLKYPLCSPYAGGGGRAESYCARVQSRNKIMLINMYREAETRRASLRRETEYKLSLRPQEELLVAGRSSTMTMALFRYRFAISESSSQSIVRFISETRPEPLAALTYSSC